MSEKDKKLNTKRWLYSFIVPRKYTEEIEEEGKDDKGEKVTIKRKVDKTEDVEVRLKRPSRKMFDDCNLFYSVKVSEGVKAGLLTRAMISKRYKNDGGGLSKQEQEDFNTQYGELLIKEKEFQVVQLNLQKDKSMTDEERQGKLKELVDEMEDLKAGLQTYEVTAEALYEHTSEARAARMTNMWWLLFLTYVKFKNESKAGIDDYMPIFGGKDFDGKSEAYELIEERIESTEDRYVHFEAELIERASYLLAAWNGGNCKTYEDFKRVETSLEYIKEEVRKDDSLQEVYDDKIKSLAGLDMPIEPPKEEPKVEPPKEKPKLEASENK